MAKIVTANTLAEGRVVFLARDGGWVANIADAATFADDASAEGAMEAACSDKAHSSIVDPFVTEGDMDRSARPSMSLRDTIRAFGPTIRYNSNGASRG